jgi:hypothetical protein
LHFGDVEEREKIVSGERKRVIDDDLAGWDRNRRKWTIMMTNEYHLVLKWEMDRKWNNR